MIFFPKIPCFFSENLVFVLLAELIPEFTQDTTAVM